MPSNHNHKGECRIASGAGRALFDAHIRYDLRFDCSLPETAVMNPPVILGPVFAPSEVSSTTPLHQSIIFFVRIFHFNGRLLMLIGLKSSSGSTRTVSNLKMAPAVCTENLIRVDDVMESPKLAE
jgi:hypothetical protein